MVGGGYHLQTFGELRLVDSSGGVAACPERGLLILAYLCVSEQKTASREKLATLIWPDREKSVAFKNLRSTLWRMRHLATADGPLLASIESEVALGTLSCDVSGFDALGGSEETFRKALALWRESFLASADLPAGRYTDWIMRKRQGFTEMLRKALIDAEERFADRSMLRSACAHLLELDPADTAVLEILERVGHGQLLNGGRTPARVLLQPTAFVGETVEGASPAAPPLPRVALLPPAALGGDPTLHTVSVAVIEDITIGLCSLRSMSVVAPYTAERIRDAADKAAFLQKHGVTYALDCRLSDQGLFTQLIFLPSDEIIWADRFTISPVGLIQQRQEIAYHVARAVTEQVERGQAEHLDYAAHPEAYYAYLGGLRHLSGLGLPDVRRARRDFRDAIRLKPDFAPALSGISRTYATEWLLTAQGNNDLLSLAERHARGRCKATNSFLPHTANWVW